MRTLAGATLLALLIAIVVCTLPYPDMAGKRRRRLFDAAPELLHRPDLVCGNCGRGAAAEDLYIYALDRPIWPFICLACDRQLAPTLVGEAAGGSS